ncbi:MAG: methyltransferase domain-containing protein [Planctomycetota bacterium]
MGLRSVVAKPVEVAARVLGYDLVDAPGPINGHRSAIPAKFIDPGPNDKAHFACGETLFDGWTNMDFGDSAAGRAAKPDAVFYRVDLLKPLPFADGVFRLAFAEDFLEHLIQADSLLFLSEARRVLKPGGVLRLSFPGLEGVLKRHFRGPDYGDVFKGREEAYELWGHVHFYSKEELATVARHLGFSDVRFCGFGESEVEELRGIDGRPTQADMNTYAELVR